MSCTKAALLTPLAGFGKRVPMEEGEGGSRRIIRTPGAFDKDLQFFLSTNGDTAKKRQRKEAAQELFADHNFEFTLSYKILSINSAK